MLETRRSVMGNLYGGIEAGGTWFVCAVGTGPGDLSAETRFPTTTPQETIRQAIDFFREQPILTAIGIGSFGPIDINRASLDYGHIMATPKPGWSNCDMAWMIHRALGLPIYLDTDVNAAALAEHRWGIAKGLDTFIYLTVGTGIGGGGIVNGQLMHGLIHPEMGHIRIPHDWN
jgi:fructokinase